MMRNITSRSFAIGMLTFSMLSCNFLSVEQIGKSDIAGYFSEVEAVQPALNGMYHEALGLYDKYLLMYPEVASDEILLDEGQSSWVLYRDFTRKSTDETSCLGYIWKQAYYTIANANEILRYMPDLKQNNPREAEFLDNAMAQAYMMRALMHFELCRVYGQNYTYTPDASHLGVPVVDHILSLTEIFSRNTVNEVYSQILSDIQKALEFFPETADADNGLYFFTPLACKALKARVCLYMGDWESARQLSKSVMDARPLVQRSGYRQMFTTKNPAMDEAIFRLHGFQTSSSAYKMHYKESPSVRPSMRVKALLSDPDDVRSSMLDFDGDNTDVVVKFNIDDKIASSEDEYVHLILFRASEMYLIHAEASLELGFADNAADDIKALRARAYGVDASKIALNYSSDAELAALIAEERVRELCFEGHRFYDLTRRHQGIERTGDNASPVKSIAYPDYRFVLPIPQVELDSNEYMVNNPGINE